MEKLTVAFSKTNSATAKILSYQNFQEMLNSWFHEKGVLTEIRLQLRFKLITLLKNTILEKDINQNNRESNDLFSQTLNLIIAEYLIQNKYYYSLSVLNLETTYTDVLQKYPIHCSVVMKENNLKNLCFNRENILHVLKLIGLTRSSPSYDKLISMYFNMEGKKSLLYCLIMLITQLPFVQDINFEKLTGNLRAMNIDTKDEIKFIHKTEYLLTQINFPVYYAKKISECINFFHETEMEQQKNGLLSLINNLKSEITSKDKNIKDVILLKDVLHNQLLKMSKNYGKIKSDLEQLLKKENLMNQVLQEKIHNQGALECYELKKLPIHTDPMPSQPPYYIKTCTENIKVYEHLSKENILLKKENERLKKILEKSSLAYENMSSKFDTYRNKMNFMNSSIHKRNQVYSNFLHGENLNPKVQLQKTMNDHEADGKTEETLHHTLILLQKLEDETKEIEEKFDFV